MGRSHGGLTTKIHVVVDASGLPIALKRLFDKLKHFRDVATPVRQVR